MAISPMSPTGVKPKKQREWVRENYGKGSDPNAMTKARKRELAALGEKENEDKD